jgi:molybdate-binding protein
MMVNATNIWKDIYKVSILEELAVIYREEGSGTRYVMEKFIENNNLNVPKSRAYGKWSGEAGSYGRIRLFYYAFNRS